MAKIDLTDPKWVDMVFAGKNKEYGAYQLRKGTSSRNITSILILLAAAAIVGDLQVLACLVISSLLGQVDTHVLGIGSQGIGKVEHAVG